MLRTVRAHEPAGVAGIHLEDQGIQRLFDGLRSEGVPPLDGLPAFGEFTCLIGLPAVQALEQRFAGVAAEPAAH